MISRFRPTYSYLNILSGLFSSQGTIEALRKQIQEMYKTEYVFLYSQARVALYFLIKSLSIRGAVISPAYNCIVVPDAIRFTGMDNQFADISLDDYNMTAKDVQKVISSRSKILLATHQFGIPCDIEAFSFLARKNNLLLIEDAAAAMGARVGGRLVGTSGIATVISFQDTKVVNGILGGCLIVYDKNIASKIKEFSFGIDLMSKLKLMKKAFTFKTATLPFIYSLAFPLWTKKAGAYTMPEESKKKMPENYLTGLNIFCASLVKDQLFNINENLNRREKIGNRYLSMLSKVKRVKLPKIKKGVKPAWVRFPIMTENKLIFYKRLSANGVDLAWTFSYSCSSEYGDRLTPNSLEAANHVLDLPIYPNLINDDIDKIIREIKNAD